MIEDTIKFLLALLIQVSLIHHKQKTTVEKHKQPNVNINTIVQI